MHQKSTEPAEDEDSQDYVFVSNLQTPNHYNSTMKSGSTITSIDESTMLGQICRVVPVIQVIVQLTLFMRKF